MLDLKGVYFLLLMLFPIFCSAQFSISMSPFNSNDYFVLKPTGIDIQSKVSFGPQLAVDVLVKEKYRLEFGLAYRNDQFMPILLGEERTVTAESALQGHVAVYRYIVSSQQTTLSLGAIVSLARIKVDFASNDILRADVFRSIGGDYLSLKLPFRIEQKLSKVFSIRYQSSIRGIYSYRHNMTKIKFSVFDQASIVYSWGNN